ncbi:SurA N-terminal domain-containing protein [Wohlfahrtiimonas populi]|uniref:SurA N-terminal domain-containing protein n=1 Tax=Wohlfahrtiimonas populi TaxID=1940240 RepID=UPI00098D41D7|nr:SurA N-terminal domain-containing protein [Wohlfahrtiimonas populi]
MMQYIRERATSKFAKFLFLGIIISFFGFGGSGFFNSINDSTVAKVNGEKIPTGVLSNAYTNYLQNNGGVLPEGVDAKTVKTQVLNSLIQEMVIAQAAEKMGIVASDDEIRTAIKSLTFLHNAEGQFDPNLYQVYLQQQGLTPAQWEENLRQQLTLQLLVSAIGNSVIITEANLEDFAKVDRENRDLAIITLPLEQFAKDVAVTDEMIATYYEQNKAKYLTEPRVKLAYVTLPEVNTDNVTVSEEEITERVLALKAKQQDNETRSANHLIIQFSTEAEKEAAVSTLNKLYDELTNGSLTFDDAKAQITALSDGLFYETGVVKKSANMQSVDEALFAMAKDEQYAKPVMSENAVHLIHLLTVNDGSDVADDSMIDDAKAALLKEKKEALTSDNVQRFQEVAEKNSDTLDLVAQEFNVEPTMTDWLNMTSKAGELADANTFQVVSQEMVLTGGKNSEAYHTDNQDIRIVRVEAYEDARPLTLDEAKDDIQETLTAIETLKKGDAMIVAMNEQLKAGQSLDEVTTAQNLDAVNFDDVEIRTIVATAQENPQLIEPLIKGFEAQKTTPATLNTFATNGTLFAVMVKDIKPGSLSGYSADEQAQLKERLKSDMAQAETILFIQGLYEQSKIETYQVPFLAE